MTELMPTLDANALAKIHSACFEDAWSALFMGALLAQPGVVALATPPENPTGFVMLRIAADEAEILTVGVLPHHRCRGLGKQLMTGALHLMREKGVQRCFLEVAADNAAALWVYEKVGFSRCGVRPKYYGSGPIQTDAVIMEKNLTTT